MGVDEINSALDTTTLTHIQRIRRMVLSQILDHAFPPYNNLQKSNDLETQAHPYMLDIYPASTRLVLKEKVQITLEQATKA